MHLQAELRKERKSKVRDLIRTLQECEFKMKWMNIIRVKRTRKIRKRNSKVETPIQRISRVMKNEIRKETKNTMGEIEEDELIPKKVKFLKGKKKNYQDLKNEREIKPSQIHSQRKI